MFHVIGMELGSKFIRKKFLLKKKITPKLYGIITVYVRGNKINLIKVRKKACSI